MRHLAVSRHFQKQLKKLSIASQKKVAQKLKDFLAVLSKKEISSGYGFKKINHDKYELRVNLKLRVVMKSEADTLVCHVVGSHEEVKKYLKRYRTK